MSMPARRFVAPSPSHAAGGRTPFPVDKTVTLDINGSTQRIRMCAGREGLPPLLVVQAGPGFPLLQEAAKFQRRLNLEEDFLVCYWDQRGCGNASQQDAASVSATQQVDDLRTILRWLGYETRQRIVVFGVSLGATFALQAAEHELDAVKAVVAISPDAHSGLSDASVAAFLRAKSILSGNRRLRAKLAKLGEPPYADPAAFQLRAGLLADLGVIERGKTFHGLLRATLFGLVRTYGLPGAVRAVRNMNLIQRRLLPQLAALDLLADSPRPAVPVHYVFGEQDPLTPAEIVKRLPAAVAAPGSTVTRVPGAGHMVHFDQPALVRSMVGRAGKEI